LEQLRASKLSLIQYLIARNAKQHAAAGSETTDKESSQEATIVLPETIPSLVGKDTPVNSSPDEQPTKDLFGNPIVTTTPTVAVYTPKPVIVETQKIVVPELEDETAMTPAPELGTWYKTGTSKEALIEMLKKLKNK